MPSLKYLFIVQGEGRGHMTQALALRALLARAGHQVCCVLVGHSALRDVPAFFLQKINAPVSYIDSPNFVYDARNRSVRPLTTLVQAARSAPRFRESLRRIDAHLRQHQPDVVVNFFEPLAGLYYALHQPAVPMVCIAHQYLFLHPAHPYPPGHPIQQRANKRFTQLTALGASRRLALSLAPLADRPDARLSVMPPLLRDEVFRQTPAQEPFFLAYLLNSGYAGEIIRWHTQNPEQVLHCFWDNHHADPVEHYDATLTFHRLDDEKFLALMARCRGLITTAGFESVCEAMYLGKPVLAVPVEGHFEQYCNSLDAVAAGAGLAGRRFDIDRFARFVPTYQSPARAFRQWVHQAEVRFVQALEAVVDSPVPVVDPVPELATA